MTRYHFHAADGRRYPDREGEELADLEAVKSTALAVFSEMLITKSAEFWKSKKFSVTVKDESGRIVAVLSAAATLDPDPRAGSPPE